jgi:exonuclease SbcD
LSRFLIVGDIHYKGVNPESRIDNYQEALDRKIREINELAVMYKAQAIIQVGDLIDSPGISYPVLIRLMHLLGESEVKWWTIPGNHDLFAANADTLPRTPLAVLAAAGIVRLLETGDEDMLISDEEYVYGCGYRSDIDNDPSNYNVKVGPYLYKGRPDGIPTIGVYHGMLVNEPIHPDIKHTLIRDIPNPPDVTICGHVHTGWGIIKRPDGKLFINPGALCRESAARSELTREIRVCQLTCEDGRITTEMIPIKSARPGYEVLSRERLERAAENNKQLDRFLDLLRDDGEIKFLQVNDIIDHISNRDSIPEDVKKLATDTIARAREELSRRCVPTQSENQMPNRS